MGGWPWTLTSVAGFSNNGPLQMLLRSTSSHQSTMHVLKQRCHVRLDTRTTCDSADQIMHGPGGIVKGPCFYHCADLYLSRYGRSSCSQQYIENPLADTSAYHVIVAKHETINTPRRGCLRPSWQVYMFKCVRIRERCAEYQSRLFALVQAGKYHYRAPHFGDLQEHDTHLEPIPAKTNQ